MSMAENSTVVDPDPISIFWLGILYIVYASFGVPANLVVLALTFHKNVRIHPTSICIFSIAVADLMSLVCYLSSTVWAFTYDMLACKVMGVGIYIFVVMSMTLPTCLAVCRYAGLHDDLNSRRTLKMLQTTKGVLILNGLMWTYGMLFMLPFILFDKIGLDAMGCCGVTEINSVLLWAYYLIFVCGTLFGAYAVTFTFYHRLSEWIRTTSSMFTVTPQANETLVMTRNIMRMIKWLIFVPLVFYYPALTVQAALRIHPNIVSVRTARIFTITVPIPHLIDPFVTLVLVKCYRTAFTEIFYNKCLVLFKSVHPHRQA